MNPQAKWISAFKDNNTVVWYIAWQSVWWFSALAIWNVSWYIWLVWSTICSGKLKIPVGTNLYN